MTRGGFSRSFKRAVNCTRVAEMRTGVEAALAAEAEKYHASGATTRSVRALRALARWRGT